MMDAQTVEACVPQPAIEVVDQLCSTIQRQSAMCVEFVRMALEAERDHCARIAESEAAMRAAQADAVGHRAAREIAERIRARAGQLPF